MKIDDLLISPAEPPSLKTIGTVSPLPESLGVDFLFPSPMGMVGVQRKEISDLLSSVQVDNRFAKELGQMKKLDIAILLIEGRLRWTTSGELMLTHGRLSLAQYRGMRFSLQSQGLWIDTTESIQDTIQYLLQLSRWTKKKNHDSLITRNNPPSGSWGQRSNRDWGVYFLQGIEGVGPGLAGKIYDRFGVPMGWTVVAEDLADIPGIGMEKARKIIGALE